MKYIYLALCLFSSLALAQEFTYGNPVQFSAYNSTPTTLNLFVTTTGSDNKDCLSTGNACLTIQGALNKVPKVIRHSVTITVGLGSFSAGAWLSNYQVSYPADLALGASLIIQGTMQTATIATGTTSSLLTSAATGAGATWGTATITSAGWTASNLRGKFATIISGTGAGQTRVIDDNTTDTITIAGVWRITPDTTSLMSIQEPGTTITGVVQRGAIQIQDTTQLSPQLNQAAFGVDGVVTNNIVASSSIIIQRFKITGVRALYNHSDSNVTFRWNWLERTDNPSLTQLILASGPSSLYVYGNYVNVTTGTSTIGFVEQAIGGYTRLLNVEGNVVVGAAEGVGVPAGAIINVLFNSFRGVGLGFHWGVLHQGSSKYNKFRTGTWCIRGDKDDGDTTSGVVVVVDNLLDTCSTGVELRGPGEVIFADSVGTSFTGTSTLGINVLEGGRVRISNLTTMAITGTELQVDTSTFTLATLRAATPKVVNNSSYFTLIYER